MEPTSPRSLHGLVPHFIQVSANMTWYEDFSQHWIQNSPSSISFSDYIFKIALKTAWNYTLGRKDQFIVRLLHPKVSSIRAVTVLFIAVSPQALDKQLAHGGSQSLNMCWVTQLIHISFKDALSLGCNHDCHSVSNVLVSLMIHLVYVTQCIPCPYICYRNIRVAASSFIIPTFC